METLNNVIVVRTESKKFGTQYIVVTEERRPKIIVNGRFQESSFVADIAITKELDNISFAKIVKKYRCEVIKKEDFKNFRIKTSFLVYHRLECSARNVSHQFFVWKKLENALFTKICMDNYERIPCVVYKVNGVIHVVRVNVAEGKFSSRFYDEENVSIPYFTLTHVDTEDIKVRYFFDNGSFIKELFYELQYENVSVKKEEVKLNYNDFEFIQNANGKMFENFEFNLKLKDSILESYKITSRIEGWQAPEINILEGMSYNGFTINADIFKHKIYPIYNIKIKQIGKPEYTKRISCSFGYDAEDRRSGLES
jgi:hypothetical protein